MRAMSPSHRAVTSGCGNDIRVPGGPLSFRAFTARRRVERRVLSQPAMNHRIALLLSCLLPLVAGSQAEAPPEAPAAQPQPPSPAPAAEPPAPTPTPEETPPAPAPSPSPEEAPASAAVPDTCPEFDDARTDETGPLGALQLRVDGQAQTLAGIEWKGLQHFTEAQVRTLSGLPAEGPLTVEQASRGLRRLARSELFARVTPTLRLIEGAAPALEVAVEEHPFVASVSFQGLQDVTPRELLEDMFHERSEERESKRREKDEEIVATLSIDSRGVLVNVAPACPPLRPPREWVARLDARGALQAGVVPGGLTSSLERALEELRDDGYLLARLTATLRADGRLEVEVDEGRIEGVDVEGVDEETAPRVRAALGIEPGDIFLRSDMSRAVGRLEAALPHLEVAGVERQRREARIVEERGEAGERRYHTVIEEKEPRRTRRRMYMPWEDLFAGWWHDWEDSRRHRGLVTRGRRVVVHVHTRRPDFDLDLLPVHTQVTGLAPGLEGRLRVWDPGDRAHLTLDAALFLPWRLGGQRIPDEPEQTRRQRRLNWLTGAKVQVPSLGLAELGGQLHDFTDTLDRWRIGAIDSYLYSALINRPDADYFRRKGAAAFATWRLGSQWLLGAEYRRDSYASLVSLSPPLSLFRRDSPPFPNAPVTESRFASVVGRLEYASDGRRHPVRGSLFRSPELPLLSYEEDWPERPALRSFVTLEVSRPSLGGDAGTAFWKLVSDSAVYLPTGHDESLRLRLRVAGGEDLPLQKREGLGGWSALRGYSFKEFRGEASALVSAEYRWEGLGAFVDLGSVRREAEWTDAKLGLGASLHLGDEVALTAAWRVDDRAELAPEVRLLFTRPF